MAHPIPLPEDKLTKLSKKIGLREDELPKCALCDNFLSVPPIMIISNNGSEAKCGRCSDILTPKCTRNDEYENIAKHLSFPCIYQVCDEKIPWTRVWKHETECPHRTMACPIYWQGCKDIVKVNELENHFRCVHRKHVFYGSIVSDVQTGNGNVFLLVKYGMKFLVYVTTKMRIAKSYIGVFALEPTPIENYQFKVKLTSKAMPHLQVSVKEQHIELFNERKYCRRCVGRECYLTYHKYSVRNCSKEYSIFEKMTTKIDSRPIRQLLLSDSMTYTITVTKIDETGPVLELFQQNVNGNNDESARYMVENKFFYQCLECPVCNNYMQAPIYICGTGHTFCNVCKPKLKSCPLCQAKIGETRNYSLESIAQNTELRCMYNKAGCIFVGTIYEIHRHEANCEYGNNYISANNDY